MPGGVELTKSKPQILSNLGWTRKKWFGCPFALLLNKHHQRSSNSKKDEPPKCSVVGQPPLLRECCFGDPLHLAYVFLDIRPVQLSSKAGLQGVPSHLPPSCDGLPFALHLGLNGRFP